MLTDEGDLNDYLGVQIARHSDGSAELLQPRMINQCLSIVSIPTRDQDLNSSLVKVHKMPMETRPVLHYDHSGPSRKRKMELLSYNWYA